MGASQSTLQKFLYAACRHFALVYNDDDMSDQEAVGTYMALLESISNEGLLVKVSKREDRRYMAFFQIMKRKEIECKHAIKQLQPPARENLPKVREILDTYAGDFIDAYNQFT